MYNNIVIFSVFRNEFADTNEKSHRSTILALNGIGIETTEVLGVYNGSSEKSIMVDATIYNYENVLSIAKIFKQESVLRVDHLGNAHLYFPENTTVLSIGTLTEVSEAEAKSNDSYTYLPDSNVYLITK
jgi:hypothetical protein